jgi:hypothetical protein
MVLRKLERNKFTMMILRVKGDFCHRGTETQRAGIQDTIGVYYL